MRKGSFCDCAIFLGAAVPLVPLLFAGEPDCVASECLLPSEAAILFYAVSVAIGAVVGIPAFLAIRLGFRPFWPRLALTGLTVGVAGFLLAWFGTQGGNRLNLIWILLLGLLSALVFGAVYQFTKGR